MASASRTMSTSADRPDTLTVPVNTGSDCRRYQIHAGEADTRGEHETHERFGEQTTHARIIATLEWRRFSACGHD